MNVRFYFNHMTLKSIKNSIFGVKGQDFVMLYQSCRKRRITRIGMHIFSLGRMIFVRREFRVRMFFSRPGAEPGDQKPFDIIDHDTLFRATGDMIIVLSLLTNCMTRTAILTGD